MFNVVCQETLKEKRRQMSVEAQVPFIFNGRRESVAKKIVSGEMETLEFTKPLGEMLTQGNVAGFKELLRKVVLDVELGREAVQVVYKPIYDLISDSNLPEVLDAKWALTGAVVFTEMMEGEEVKFGTLQAEYGPVARILTYAAGFEYTKKIKDFNQSFQIEILNKAIGEAYNALCNHLHLSPIISFTYKSSNQTAFKGAAGDPTWLGFYKTINQGLKDAVIAKRPANILLTSKANQTDVEMALRGGHQIEGSVYPSISGIDTVIYYDGWEVTVGKKTYSYPGISTNKAYLIRPKRGFKELLKQDLQVEASAGDLSRLVEQQIVGYAYRGVYAAVGENVQELTLG